MSEEYRCLIESFVKIDKTQKQIEIKEELKEVLMVFSNLCDDKNVLTYVEMKKLLKEGNDEEKFLNEIYSSIVLIKELIGQYLINK